MPENISTTRKNLTGHVARFRLQGLDAEPVVFGTNRQPDAALIPYETFELLMDVAEDIAIAERVRERASRDSGTRSSLADAAAEFDIDLDEL